MGADPYWYFAPYQTDVEKALKELQIKEFEAGRYNPVTPFPDFPVTPDSEAPGAKHDSIDEARIAGEEDGTRSILDIQSIVDEPCFLGAFELQSEDLIEIYNTEKPTRKMVEENMDFFDYIDRGHALYFVIYKDEMPSEILFAGYSVD